MMMKDRGKRGMERVESVGGRMMEEDGREEREWRRNDEGRKCRKCRWEE